MFEKSDQNVVHDTKTQFYANTVALNVIKTARVDKC